MPVQAARRLWDWEQARLQVRTASRGQVYLGGALWQMLQSAVRGVDESAMLCVCLEKKLWRRENVRVED
jgi:hypothetical protein